MTVYSRSDAATDQVSKKGTVLKQEWKIPRGPTRTQYYDTNTHVRAIPEFYVNDGSVCAFAIFLRKGQSPHPPPSNTLAPFLSPPPPPPPPVATAETVPVILLPPFPGSPPIPNRLSLLLSPLKAPVFSFQARGGRKNLPRTPHPHRGPHGHRATVGKKERKEGGRGSLPRSFWLAAPMRNSRGREKRAISGEKGTGEQRDDSLLSGPCDPILTPF